MAKTIVYCKSIKDCGRLFRLFRTELGKDSFYPSNTRASANNLLCGMFYNVTLIRCQFYWVLNSFHKKEGTCRLVFANIFIMLLVWVLTSNLCKLEICRGGRDGEDAHCDLLYHFKCAGLTVKDYKQLQSNSNQTWMCSICTLRNFPNNFAIHFNFKRFNAVII